MIHIVYLGDTFLDSYFTLKKEILTREIKEKYENKNMDDKRIKG